MDRKYLAFTSAYKGFLKTLLIKIIQLYKNFRFN